MSKVDDIKEEIQKLIEEGNEVIALFEGKIEQEGINRYQNWYSKSMRLVEQIFLKRSKEFMFFYGGPATYNTSERDYSIKQYLCGDYFRYGINPDKDKSFKIAHFKMMNQIGILSSLTDVIDSNLNKITSLLQADIFDNELETAKHLLKEGHIGAAGAIAGVVLEGHLKQICKDHAINIDTPKKPTLNNYNVELCKSDVYDQSIKRKIEFLGDIRNKCVHPDNKPSEEEVEELINGVDKVIKTVS